MKQTAFLKLLGLGAFITLLWLFAPFLKSFCIALLMAMAIAPLHRFFEMRISNALHLRNSANLIATSLSTLLFAVMLFLPLSIFLFQLFEHPSRVIELIRTLGSHLNLKSDMLPEYLSWLEEPFEKFILLTQMHKDEIIAFATKWLSSGLKTFLNMLSEMLMILIFFFFVTLYSKPFLLFFMPIIPLSRTIKRQFFHEMSTTMAVVFYTLLGVILFQGIAFGVFIAFFDGYNAFLLGFLAGITSLIPLLGTALVWIPVAFGEYLTGHTMNAIIIALYSWAMMSFFIDNIVKLLILKFINQSISGGAFRTHEFIIFFAIIGGLASFGFWGFLIGPALVAFAITTFKILRKLSQPTW